MSTAVKKRKHSNSPTRKKARTEESDKTEAPTKTRTESKEEVLTPRPMMGTSVAPEPAAPAPATKPKNPFAGKVKNLRGNFGTGYHDTAHFRPTTEKTHHGVWQAKLPQVKTWVRLALDSIYEDDRFVVASKPGTSGTYRYLVFMDGVMVGYLSGSSVPSGDKPEAKHIEVYLDSKGNTVTAFPSSPEIF